MTVDIGETCRSFVGVMVLLLANVGGFNSMLPWNWRANTIEFNAVETRAKKAKISINIKEKMLLKLGRIFFLKNH